MSVNYLSALGEELAGIANALKRVGEKLQALPKVPQVKITKHSDPEMFTREFISIVRKSRQDFDNGRYVDYKTFRKTLDL